MSVEMQEYVIGCIFEDVNKEYIRIDELNEGLFPDTRVAFKAILQYRLDNKPAELKYATEILGGDIAKIVAQFKGTISNYSLYIKELKKTKALNDISDKLMHTGSLDKDDIEAALEAYTDKPINKNIYDMKDNLHDWIADLENRIAGRVEWYSWGVDFLDRELGKLKMGKMYIIKAIRKKGKTTMAVRLFNSFMQNSLPTVFISTETGYNDIIDKLAALNTQINSFRIQEGTLLKGELEKITEAVRTKIYDKPGKIVICTQLTMDFIRKTIDEHKAKILIIDFLQMLQVLDIPDGMNRTQMLDDMAIALKGICLEKNISIIGLSQINSEGWSKGCKAFEEKADCIMALLDREKGIETVTSTQLVLDILNRNGKSGAIKILYMKQYGDFAEDKD